MKIDNVRIELSLSGTLYMHKIHLIKNPSFCWNAQIFISVESSRLEKYAYIGEEH